MDVPSYLHVMDGRLRVKIPEMKRSAQRARHVEELISALEGVIQASANPTTGNLLVLYHSHVLAHTDIILTLKKAEYLRIPPPVSSTGLTAHLAGLVSQAIARSVAEMLMERAILALL